METTTPPHLRNEQLPVLYGTHADFSTKEALCVLRYSALPKAILGILVLGIGGFLLYMILITDTFSPILLFLGLVGMLLVAAGVFSCRSAFRSARRTYPAFVAFESGFYFRPTSYIKDRLIFLPWSGVSSIELKKIVQPIDVMGVRFPSKHICFYLDSPSLERYKTILGDTMPEDNPLTYLHDGVFGTPFFMLADGLHAFSERKIVAKMETLRALRVSKS